MRTDRGRYIIIEMMMNVELLQIEPTTRCNLHCPFCCGKHQPQGDLSLAVFDGVLESFPGLSHMLLQGEGEPLLHPSFFAMAERARQRGIAVTTITNGSLFTPDNVASTLDAGIDKVLISLESPDHETFQSLRGISFDHVLRGIERLLENREQRGLDRPAVGLSLVVLQRTRHEIPALVDLYHRLGLDGGIPVFQPLERVQPYLQHYDDEFLAELIPPEQWHELEQEVRRDERARAALDGGWEKKGFVEEFVTDWSLAGGRCPWLERAGFITWQGYVMSCCTVKDGRRHGFGRIGESGLDTMAAARDRLRAQLRSGQIPEPCQGCEIAATIAREATNGDES